MLDQPVAQQLFFASGDSSQPRYAIDHIACQMKAVEIVHHRHVERRCGGALFFIAAHVHIVVIGAAIGQAMNEPRIAVECEDDGFIGGEDGVEIAVGETVGMLGGRLERHQIDDVDHANFSNPVYGRVTNPRPRAFRASGYRRSKP